MQSATLNLLFLTVRLDFAYKGKEETDWNLNSTNKLYRKKQQKHLNVQVDFQTFLLKEEGSKV